MDSSAMNRNTHGPKFFLAVLAAHLVVTTLVWRDIAGRSADELRGSKAFWRTLTAANTGNSLLYVLVGRRR
jgi:hypothetical protein